MKRQLLLLSSLLFSVLIYSQGVGINSNGNIPVDGAMLDISSTTSGLLIPRMTQVQRDLIEAGSPPQSLLIYQTDQDSGFYYYDGSSWIPFLVGGASINGGWETKGNTGTTPANNFIGTIDSLDWVIRTDSTEQMRVMANGNVGIGKTSPISTLDVSGSVGLNVTTLAANTTLDDSHNIVLCNNSSNITITLPAAADNSNRTYYIKKISNNTNTVVIDPNGAETVDGATDITLYIRNDLVRIVCDGSNWFIIDDERTPHVAQMTRTLVQNIPNVTNTKILLNSEDYDNAGIADEVTNNRFNILRGGKYRVEASGGSELLDDKETMRLMVYVNGSSVKNAMDRTPTNALNGTVQCDVSATIDVTAGDYVELYMRHAEGGTMPTMTITYPCQMSVSEIR